MSSGRRLDRFSVSTYDAATQLMHMRLFYERYDASGTLETSRAHDLTIRTTNRDELKLMLGLAGFESRGHLRRFRGRDVRFGERSPHRARQEVGSGSRNRERRVIPPHHT